MTVNDYELGFQRLAADVCNHVIAKLKPNTNGVRPIIRIYNILQPECGVRIYWDDHTNGPVTDIGGSPLRWFLRQHPIVLAGITKSIYTTYVDIWRDDEIIYTY